MNAIIENAQTFIDQNRAYAPFIIALVAFGESLFLIGFVIPATALMVAFGGLIGAGTLSPLPVLAGSALGATLGDAVSYWLGRWFGPAMMKWPLMRRHRRTLLATRLFFARFGFVSVFAGRFLGPVRSTIPLVAGIMAMAQVPFQVANAVSAVLWSVVMLMPGWLAGRGASFLNPETPGEWILLMAGFTAVLLGVTTLAGRLLALRGRRDPVAARAAARAALRAERARGNMG